MICPVMDGGEKESTVKGDENEPEVDEKGGSDGDKNVCPTAIRTCIMKKPNSRTIIIASIFYYIANSTVK